MPCAPHLRRERTSPLFLESPLIPNITSTVLSHLVSGSRLHRTWAHLPPSALSHQVTDECGQVTPLTTSPCSQVLGTQSGHLPSGERPGPWLWLLIVPRPGHAPSGRRWGLGQFCGSRCVPRYSRWGWGSPTSLAQPWGLWFHRLWAAIFYKYEGHRSRGVQTTPWNHKEVPPTEWETRSC